MFGAESARDHAEAMERDRALPRGRAERMAGYGVLGVGYASGDVLALRRITASSVGPPFTTVWHRDPGGRWTFYLGAEPRRTCPRYFGGALSRAVVTELELRWTGPGELSVTAPARRLEWAMRLRSTPRTRLGGLLARAVPGALRRREGIARIGSAAAGRVLGAEGLTVAGAVPNGQRFLALPRWFWEVEGSVAVVEGRELGPSRTLPSEVALGDFRLPRRGLFVAGSALFEAFDPSRHLTAVAARGVERSLGPAGRG